MKKHLAVAIGLIVLLSSSAAFAGSYVKLYRDKGMLGPSVTTGFKKNLPDLHAQGMNDEVSSAQYSIPSGWTAVLHADTGYGGRTYVLRGRGSIPDLGSFNDKASSLEWRR